MADPLNTKSGGVAREIKNSHSGRGTHSHWRAEERAEKVKKKGDKLAEKKGWGW